MNQKNKDSFIFYRSFYEAIKELPKENQINIYDAIMEMSLNGKESSLNGIDKTIFTLIKPQIQANNKRYENGTKGGRPKNLEETKTEPKNNQKITKTKPNKNDNDNVNDNNKEKFHYYEGNVIKLNKADFEKWQSLYKNLDLEVELYTRDMWLSANPQKNWFLSTAQYLANKNKESKPSCNKPYIQKDF